MLAASAPTADMMLLFRSFSVTATTVQHRRRTTPNESELAGPLPIAGNWRNGGRSGTILYFRDARSLNSLGPTREPEIESARSPSSCPLPEPRCYGLGVRDGADLQLLTDEVAAFVEVIDNLYGVYLDACSGFGQNVQTVERAQAETRLGLPEADLDSLPFFMGRGSPNDPSNVMQHKTTQGAFKTRNATGGHNEVLLGQMLVVMVYEHWDSRHRQRLADALGIPTKDLKSPLFGDLRLLRIDVLHRHGIVQKDTVKKAEVIKGLVEGEVVRLSRETVEEVVRGIKAVLDHLVVEQGGEDPKHRTVWHVR